MTGNTGLHMPQLHRIELAHFSLYSQRRRIAASFGDGVFCLAGANGLGKSTFLAALSYGLTGVVPPEKPTFKSMAQYYSRCVAFSRDYFDGRITQRDRESAEIMLEFSVYGSRYIIRRNPFESDALRFLEVRDSTATIVIPNDEIRSDQARHDLYRDRLVSDIGLSSFPQFVFLQHFLLTFDERRRTLFWDEDNAEKVLYLALGIDPELAEKADELRKTAEGADSLARNAQYDATTARTRLDDIQKAKSEVSDDPSSTDAIERLETADAKLAAVTNRLEAALAKLSDARLAMAAASAAELKAREEYERQFNLRVAPHPAPRVHPLVVETLKSHTCPVCSTKGDQVAAKIQEDLDSLRCPLCASPVAPQSQADVAQGHAEGLQKADRDLGNARDVLELSRQRVMRLERDVEIARESFDQAQREVRAAEGPDSSRRTTRPVDTRAGLEALESRVQHTIDEALARKEQHLKKRSEALNGLRPLRKLLLKAFAEAELELVPLFRELATEFLGLPLDITLSPVGSERVRLLLTVKNERRRTGDQLSESQRYFLDIALRMALAIHMSAKGHPASLYIDTPEGSLDIAYESRAGAMFAAFAGRGHPLIMTANINTSQLLLRLAEECGTERMTLVRMTDWTNLSDVQAAEEHRIEDAYRAIEQALSSRAATPEVVTWVGRAHE